MRRCDYGQMNHQYDDHDDSLVVSDVVETCLGSGIGAGLLVWFVMFPLIGRAAGLFPDGWVNGGGLGLTASGLGVAIVLAAMLIAVHWRFHRSMRRTGLFIRLSSALAASALVSTALLTAFAAHEQYATTPKILASEVLMGVPC